MTRITTSMMTNTTLKHINRNMRNLDNIIQQIETGRQIQRPSDNPITASRALKFRTSQAQNDQFQRNVLNGMSWMNVTESTFTNINSELMRQIRDILVSGDSPETISQLQGMVGQMRSFFDQIGHEMNQTYAGSHLFSGFRTDEPPIFTRDNNRSFVVTQHFNISDISRTQSFQRLENSVGIVEPYTRDISVLNLAFRGLDTPPLAAPVAPATWPTAIENPSGINIPGFHVRKVSINDPQAYNPDHLTGPGGLPVIHLIHETGELVMHSDTASIFPREGVSVSYQRTGFRQGEINPAVYFTAREIITDPRFVPLDDPAQVETTFRVTQYFSRAAASAASVPGDFYVFELAYEADFAAVLNGVFSHNATALHPQLPPGIPATAFVAGNPSTITIPAGFFDTASNFSVTYSVTDPPPAIIPPETVASTGVQAIMRDLNVQGVELVRAVSRDAATGFAAGTNIPLDLITNHRSMDMHNQNIQLEFSTHTHVAINSLAKNVLTDKMFADFRRFFEFAESLHITERSVLEEHFRAQGLEDEELERAIVDQLTRETSMTKAALQSQFNNMLYLVDRHLDNTNREQTLLGARMVRLDLLHARLEQDAVTFELLIRDNEATDIPRALIMKASAEAIFMASLRANSGVVQMSLAQFIG